MPPSGIVKGVPENSESRVPVSTTLSCEYVARLNPVTVNLTVPVSGCVIETDPLASVSAE